jgi:hypothetical protein
MKVSMKVLSSWCSVCMRRKGVHISVLADMMSPSGQDLLCLGQYPGKYIRLGTKQPSPAVHGALPK